MAESSSGFSKQLRSRAWNAMLSSAFFSVPSAILIGLTIVLFGLQISPFSWWMPTMWLLFGLVSEIIYIIATITDPIARQKAVERMLVERYNPADIRNLVARERLKKAFEYYKNMQHLAKVRLGASQSEFQHTLYEVENWLGRIYELGLRIDRFEASDLVNRDRHRVPAELDALRNRLKFETDPRVKEDIERSIEIKEKQLENLRLLEANGKRSEIQMENTLSALATVYAQMQVRDASILDNASARRLRNEIHDQVLELQDTIVAMDEVHRTTTV